MLFVQVSFYRIFEDTRPLMFQFPSFSTHTVFDSSRSLSTGMLWNFPPFSSTINYDLHPKYSPPFSYRKVFYRCLLLSYLLFDDAMNTPLLISHVTFISNTSSLFSIGPLIIGCNLDCIVLIISLYKTGKVWKDVRIFYVLFRSLI